MPRKKIYFIFVVFILVLAYAAYRDYRYAREFSYDLRNRVVGARMEKDGVSPYFHNWQPGDSIRYYDPNASARLAVTNITATPLFHQLLYPLAEWDQSTINDGWLIVQYAMLLLMIAAALRQSVTDTQRVAVLVVAGLFLLTDAWKNNVYLGQIYLCIPFLAMTFYGFIRRAPGLFNALVAGTAAILLMGIRPNAGFFFIPFLFLLHGYSRRYLVFFGLPALLLIAWTVADPKERGLWQDYRLAMAEHVKEHQSLHPAPGPNTQGPDYPRWEGIDRIATKRADSLNPMKIHSENGNVFVLYENIFHRKISPILLFILSLCGIAGLLTVFNMRRYGPGHGGACYPRDHGKTFRYGTGASAADDAGRLAILGFCLYMITDLFSPVYRHQYYTVQWIFPLLLAAAIYRPAFKWSFSAMVAGLLLNISRIGPFKMQHTVGEYLILAAFLALVLRLDGWNRPEPVSLPHAGKE